MNNARPKSIVADFMKNAQTAVKFMLDEQPAETLEAVQQAVLAGAALSIEVRYPADGVPVVVLWLITPNASRQAVTNLVFTHGSLQ